MARVLVADRAALFGGTWPQGFVPLDGAAAERFLADAARRSRFEDRPAAECNPAWKQWIPYCVIRRVQRAVPGGTAAPADVFHVCRTKGQSEARLHGLWSIGLGGHVEPEDAPHGHTGGGVPPATFAAGLARELTEELVLAGTEHLAPPRFAGVLNDDRSAVGQVHAGLVYLWDLELPRGAAVDSVRIREISKMRGGFGSLVEFRDLWQDPARFESWSQFLVRAGVTGPMGDPALE